MFKFVEKNKFFLLAITFLVTLGHGYLNTSARKYVNQDRHRNQIFKLKLLKLLEKKPYTVKVSVLNIYDKYLGTKGPSIKNPIFIVCESGIFIMCRKESVTKPIAVLWSRAAVYLFTMLHGQDTK